MKAIHPPDHVTHSSRDILNPGSCSLNLPVLRILRALGQTAQVAKGPRVTSQPQDLEKSSLGKNPVVEEVRAS